MAAALRNPLTTAHRSLSDRDTKWKHDTRRTKRSFRSICQQRAPLNFNAISFVTWFRVVTVLRRANRLLLFPPGVLPASAYFMYCVYQELCCICFGRIVSFKPLLSHHIFKRSIQRFRNYSIATQFLIDIHCNRMCWIVYYANGYFYKGAV